MSNEPEVQLTIPGVPFKVRETLKERAEADHRSLAAYVRLVLIEHAESIPPTPAEKLNSAMPLPVAA